MPYNKHQQKIDAVNDLLAYKQITELNSKVQKPITVINKSMTCQVIVEDIINMLLRENAIVTSNIQSLRDKLFPIVDSKL